MTQSKFLLIYYKPRNNDYLLIKHHSCLSPVVNESIAELMETLCLHINRVLRLPLPAQKRSCLVSSYWALCYGGPVFFVVRRKSQAVLFHVAVVFFVF